MKYFHADITDEEANNWTVKASATVRIKKGKSTPSNQSNSIFDYAMIGARRKPATHDYQYVGYMPWNAESRNRLFYFTNYNKGKVTC